MKRQIKPNLLPLLGGLVLLIWIISGFFLLPDITPRRRKHTGYSHKHPTGRHSKTNL